MEMEMEEGETTNVRSFPHDIAFDILTRLPVKSLSRFRCVSKLWDSTISDCHFGKAHHNRTLTRSDATSVLITFPDKFTLARLLYTVDHHRENEDPIADHLLTLSGFTGIRVSESLNGIISLELGSKLLICNPSTREFITLPTVEREPPPSPMVGRRYSKGHFGYDPINNEHKVLNTFVIETGDLDNEMIMEHRVFVLGAFGWRRIGDGPPHRPRFEGVCVDGILYYRAWTRVADIEGSDALVAFDVRLETFRFVEQPHDASQLYDDSALINFDGNLAIVDYQHLKDDNTMNIWVLEDPVKPSWIHENIVFSPDWRDFQEDRVFDIAGTIPTGEIIMAPRNLRKPFYLYYLDVKNHSVRRVEIRSLPDFEWSGGISFSLVSATAHVESILSLSDLNY